MRTSRNSTKSARNQARANSQQQPAASSFELTPHCSPPTAHTHCSHPAAVYAAPEEQIKAARAWTRWENTTSNLYGPKGEAREKKLRPACTHRERARESSRAAWCPARIRSRYGLSCKHTIVAARLAAANSGIRGGCLTQWPALLTAAQFAQCHPWQLLGICRRGSGEFHRTLQYN